MHRGTKYGVRAISSTRSITSATDESLEKEIIAATNAQVVFMDDDTAVGEAQFTYNKSSNILNVERISANNISTSDLTVLGELSLAALTGAVAQFPISSADDGTIIISAKSSTQPDISQAVIEYDKVTFGVPIDVSPGIISEYTSSSVKLNDAANPALVTDNKTIMGAINELHSYNNPTADTYTYWVNKNSTSITTPNGTRSAPFKTIDAALSAIGDPADLADERKRIVVNVHSGMYDEDVIIPAARAITLNAVGYVIVGDGTGQDFTSTTARTLYIVTDSTNEFASDPKQTFHLTSQNSNSTYSAASHYGGTGWRISGDVSFTDALGSTGSDMDVTISNTLIEGSVITNSAQPFAGTANLMMDNVNVLGNISGPTHLDIIKLQNVNVSGNISYPESIGQIIDSRIAGSIDVTNLNVIIGLPPSVINSYIGGTFGTTTAASIYVDSDSEFLNPFTAIGHLVKNLQSTISQEILAPIELTPTNSPYTTAEDSYIVADTTDGDISITLAVASTVANQIIFIKKSVEVNNINLYCQIGETVETVDQSSTPIVLTEFGTIKLLSDGISNWLKVGSGAMSIWTESSATNTITPITAGRDIATTGTVGAAGIEFEGVQVNPGSPNAKTLWLNSTNSDLYMGSLRVAMRIENVITVAVEGGDYTDIQSAIDVATSETIIYVYPGIYDGDLTIRNNLTMKSISKYAAVVRGRVSFRPDRAYTAAIYNFYFHTKNSENIEVDSEDDNAQIYIEDCSLNSVWGDGDHQTERTSKSNIKIVHGKCYVGGASELNLITSGDSVAGHNTSSYWIDGSEQSYLSSFNTCHTVSNTEDDKQYIAIIVNTGTNKFTESIIKNSINELIGKSSQDSWCMAEYCYHTVGHVSTITNSQISIVDANTMCLVYRDTSDIISKFTFNYCRWSDSVSDLRMTENIDPDGGYIHALDNIYDSDRIPKPNGHGVTYTAHVNGGTFHASGKGIFEDTLYVRSSSTLQGPTHVTNSTNSTSITSGALRVTGGISTQKNLFVGGDINIAGGTTLQGKLAITDSTSATSTTTGALQVTGGISTQENLYVGGVSSLNGGVKDTDIVNAIPLGDSDNTALNTSLGAASIVGATNDSTRDQLYRDESGLYDWTGSGDYYDAAYLASDNKFRLLRGGSGYVKGDYIHWVGPQETDTIAQYSINFIGISAAGVLTLLSSHTLMHTDYVNICFIYRGATEYMVYTESHIYGVAQSQLMMYFTHNIGSIVYGSGAIINKLGTGNGGAVADRQLEILGTATLQDSSLDTIIQDSTGVGATFSIWYTDNLGRYVHYVTTDTFPIEYNNAGTPTQIANKKFGVYTIAVGKGDLNSDSAKLIAIMEDQQYNSRAKAKTAIDNGSVVKINASFFDAEMGQLGFIIVKYLTSTGGYIKQVVVRKSSVGDSSITQLGGSTQAQLVSTDEVQFDGALSSADTNVQLALETLDERGKTAEFSVGISTPTIYSPAATDLTIGTTDGGTSITLTSATADPIISNPVTITNTSGASSITTGALRVAGGISTEENLYIGSELDVAGMIYAHDDLAVDGILNVANDVTFHGSLTVTFGIVAQDEIDVSGAVYAHDDLSVDGVLNVANTTTLQGPTLITNTTSATSTTTGALQVTGGISTQDNLWVDKTTNVGGIVTITDTTNAADYQHGALVVAGGGGFGGDVRTAGSFYAGTATTRYTDGIISHTGLGDFNWSTIGSAIITIDSGQAGSKSYYIKHGDGTTLMSVDESGNAYFAGTISGAISSNGITSNDNINLTFNADGSGTDTINFIHNATTVGVLDSAGGLNINGGLMAGGNSIVNGIASITDTTDTNDTGGGALQVSGGISAQKDVYIGENLHIGDTSALTLPTTNHGIVALGNGSFVGNIWTGGSFKTGQITLSDNGIAQIGAYDLALSSAGSVIVTVDSDQDGTELFKVNNGAGNTVMSTDEAGAVTTYGGSMIVEDGSSNVMWSMSGTGIEIDHRYPQMLHTGPGEEFVTLKAALDFAGLGGRTDYIIVLARGEIPGGFDGNYTMTNVIEITGSGDKESTIVISYPNEVQIHASDTNLAISNVVIRVDSKHYFYFLIENSTASNFTIRFIDFEYFYSTTDDAINLMEMHTHSSGTFALEFIRSYIHDVNIQAALIQIPSVYDSSSVDVLVTDSNFDSVISQYIFTFNERITYNIYNTNFNNCTAILQYQNSSTTSTSSACTLHNCVIQTSNYVITVSALNTDGPTLTFNLYDCSIDSGSHDCLDLKNSNATTITANVYSCHITTTGDVMDFSSGTADLNMYNTNVDNDIGDFSSYDGTVAIYNSTSAAHNSDGTVTKTNLRQPADGLMLASVHSDTKTLMLTAKDTGIVYAMHSLTGGSGNTVYFDTSLDALVASTSSRRYKKECNGPPTNNVLDLDIKYYQYITDAGTDKYHKGAFAEDAYKVSPRYAIIGAFADDVIKTNEWESYIIGENKNGKKLLVDDVWMRDITFDMLEKMQEQQARIVALEAIVSGPAVVTPADTSYIQDNVTKDIILAEGRYKDNILLSGISKKLTCNTSAVIVGTVTIRGKQSHMFKFENIKFLGDIDIGGDNKVLFTGCTFKCTLKTFGEVRLQITESNFAPKSLISLTAGTKYKIDSSFGSASNFSIVGAEGTYSVI